MKNICVIYGSSTGTCQGLAEKIGQQLGVQDDGIIDVQNLSADVVNKYDVLILGTSTWGAGEMQDDWYDGVKVLKQAGLQGKAVAVFGCGDSESYSDTFCGGMAELYNAAKDAGATMMGEVATDGYNFDDSEAVVDGKFVGLALDEVNEDDKTDSRIEAWVEELKKNLD
ncbi:MAG: flavodoxin FldA [Prevotella sp.]|nr:flavodoxin FldA [Prevotella sp.]